MRKFGFVVLAFIGILVALYSVMTRHMTTVSAQQILEKAAAVQAEMDNTQGIWHVRIINYQNPLAFDGEAGSTTIFEDYYDYVHGYYRSTSEDMAGNLINAGSTDQQYFYYTRYNDGDPLELPIVVYRTPAKTKPRQNENGADEQTARQLDFDPAANRKATFKQFISSPRVRLEEKVTRQDGHEAYVLVGDNYQTYNRGDGKEEHALTGSMKMVFDAETYQYLESELTVRIDGEDIVLNSVQYLVDEILPVDTPVAWDLSDLTDVTYEDEPEEPQSETVTDSVSRQELAQYGNFYAPADLKQGCLP